MTNKTFIQEFSKFMYQMENGKNGKKYWLPYFLATLRLNFILVIYSNIPKSSSTFMFFSVLKGLKNQSHVLR